MPETAATNGVLDISADGYFAIRALSNSGMKDMAVSPLRFWHRHVNPHRDQTDEETAAMRLGTALHCAVLEGADVFADRYARAYEHKRMVGALVTVADMREWIEQTGNKPKGTRKDDIIAQVGAISQALNIPVRIWDQEKAAWDQQAAGKIVLSCQEWDNVDAMAVALRSEPVIQKILAEGKAEVPMVAKDPDTGVLLKCKLDWMAPGVTLDLKTFTQKRGASIDKSIADAIYYERYWIQAYLYSYIRKLVTGEHSTFVLAFVESDQPHEVRIKKLQSKGDVEANLYWQRAAIEVRAMIRMFAEYTDKYGDRPWRDPQKAEALTDDDVRQFSY